jgi:replicative DNA helicase
MKSQKRTSDNKESLVLGKISPQYTELEEIVLGTIMVDSLTLPVAMGLLTTDSFYKIEHIEIFKACKLLYDAGTPIDIMTVTEKLRELGKLDMVGGPYSVTILTTRISSGANIEVHCRILMEKQMKRAIIQSAADCYNMAFDDSSDAFDCIDILDKELQRINAIIASGGNLQPLSRVLNNAEVEAKRREFQYKSGKCTGIETGLYQLNKLTGGFQNSELIIVAGRPSMGKTALMIHHALNAGVHVCIYSLEMQAVSLANRMILSLANLDPKRFLAGALNESDWEQFYKAKDKLSKLPIYIDDNAMVTTRYIKSHSKLMRDKGQCDIIFIDYLQLTDMRTDQHGRNREQEVSQATREFKIIAKTLNIPVVLLSQLSRESEKRGDKRPMLSDLRESGAIEQDADVVIFVFRPDYYGLKDEEGNSTKGIGYEIIAKGRNIGTGVIPFRHNESMTKIWDYEEEGFIDRQSACAF